MSYQSYQATAFTGLDTGQSPDEGVLATACLAQSWDTGQAFQRVVRIDNATVEWRFYFDNAIAAADLTTLNGIVAAHTGSEEAAGTETVEQGVDTVNGQTGEVTLGAADVGADASGTAAAAVTAHAGEADPHTQYTTAAEAAAAAPVQSVNGNTGDVALGAADVGADAAGTATAAVATHAGEADPHSQYTTAAEAAAAAPVQSVNGQTGDVTVAAGTFGQGVVHDTSDGWQTSFSTSTWSDKASITITSGTWLVQWSYVWALNSTSRDFEGRILAGTTEAWVHKQEPKDSSGTGATGVGTDQKHPASGFTVLTVSANTSVKLQWRTTHSSVSASIAHAALIAWKIA